MAIHDKTANLSMKNCDVSPLGRYNHPVLLNALKNIYFPNKFKNLENYTLEQLDKLLQKVIFHPEKLSLKESESLNKLIKNSESPDYSYSLKKINWQTVNKIDDLSHIKENDNSFACILGATLPTMKKRYQTALDTSIRKDHILWLIGDRPAYLNDKDEALYFLKWLKFRLNEHLLKHKVLSDTINRINQELEKNYTHEYFLQLTSIFKNNKNFSKDSQLYSPLKILGEIDLMLKKHQLPVFTPENYAAVDIDFNNKESCIKHLNYYMENNFFPTEVTFARHIISGKTQWIFNEIELRPHDHDFASSKQRIICTLNRFKHDADFKDGYPKTEKGLSFRPNTADTIISLLTYINKTIKNNDFLKKNKPLDYLLYFISDNKYGDRQLKNANIVLLDMLTKYNNDLAFNLKTFIETGEEKLTLNLKEYLQVMAEQVHAECDLRKKFNENSLINNKVDLYNDHAVIKFSPY